MDQRCRQPLFVLNSSIINRSSIIAASCARQSFGDTQFQRRRKLQISFKTRAAWLYNFRLYFARFGR